MRRRDIDGFGGAARHHLRWGCHLHQPKAQDLAELQQGIRVATHEVLLVLNLTAAAEARAHDGARLVVTRQFEVKLLRVELGPQAPSPRQRGLVVSGVALILLALLVAQIDTRPGALEPRLAAVEAEDKVARHDVESPERKAAIERRVRAAKLGECLLEQQHPQFVAVGLREERLAVRRTGHPVVHDERHPIRHAVVVQLDPVLAVGIDLTSQEEPLQQSGPTLSQASACGQQPAVAESTLANVVMGHAIADQRDAGVGPAAAAQHLRRPLPRSIAVLTALPERRGIGRELLIGEEVRGIGTLRIEDAGAKDLHARPKVYGGGLQWKHNGSADEIGQSRPLALADAVEIKVPAALEPRALVLHRANPLPRLNLEPLGLSKGAGHAPPPVPLDCLCGGLIGSGHPVPRLPRASRERQVGEKAHALAGRLVCRQMISEHRLSGRAICVFAPGGLTS